MAPAIRTFLAAPAMALALAALAACGGDKVGSEAKPEAAPVAKLFPDDFKGVCSGASVSAATAYDPAGTAHKAVYLATYKDDLMDQSTSLPDDWTVQFSPDKDAYKAVDLVVCAKRTAQREVKICDGYKDKGKPTANKVRWHTATYALSVHEATTGKKLADSDRRGDRLDLPVVHELRRRFQHRRRLRLTLRFHRDGFRRTHRSARGSAQAMSDRRKKSSGGASSSPPSAADDGSTSAVRAAFVQR